MIACEIDSNELLSDFRVREIERWFTLHEDNNCKLDISKQVMCTIAKDVNPFVKIDEEGKNIRDNKDVCRLL